MRYSITGIVTCVLFLLCGSITALADQVSSEELTEIKELLAEQAEMIRALKSRVEELEGEATPTSAAAPTPPTQKIETAETGMPPSPTEEAEEAVRLGHRAPVIYRHTMNDRQSAAARAGDYTLDPSYRGFIPVPNTAVMIKFNAKPRVDFMGDTGNPGTDFRFVPAKFPASSDDGWQFSGNANGSQIIVDVRAPSVKGTPRFYYQNDFFGSNDSHMNYRLQHLYGEYAGFLTGFTFGVFEDPDAWPNTVDYEGPNSVIFARRAVLQYKREIFKNWVLTLGLENPDIFVDTTGDTGADQRSRAPDGGFAISWAPGELGHLRMSTIFRSIAVDGEDFSNDDVFGWGINASGNLKLTSKDNAQFWFVYGEGVGGMGNDTSFVDSDAAFKASGNLEALEYWSTMIALTHQWSPQWSSTLTHGYVNLENTAMQAGGAYHESHYGSINIVYQMFKRLRVGIEGLYGYKEVNDGRDNDIFRIQAGAAFSLFD
jgi:hypothetical protein